MEGEMALKVHNWNARMLKHVLILNKCTKTERGTSYLFQWSASLHFTNITSIPNFLALIKLLKYLMVILKIYQTFDENDA